MGNLNALFSLAYDRGGKVIDMIQNRLGNDRFFAFFQKIYHDYAFETFHYADLKRELAAFDPSYDWNTFLDGWLIEHKDTDWAVERVKVDSATGPTDPRVVTVELNAATPEQFASAGGKALKMIWPLGIAPSLRVAEAVTGVPTAPPVALAVRVTSIVPTAETCPLALHPNSAVSLFPSPS